MSIKTIPEFNKKYRCYGNCFPAFLKIYNLYIFHLRTVTLSGVLLRKEVV